MSPKNVKKCFTKKKNARSKKMLKIEETVGRIGKIISGLKAISRNAESDPMEKLNLRDVIEDSIVLSKEKFKREDNKLIIDYDERDIYILGRRAQVTQVLINLFNNSIDALEGQDSPWTKLCVRSLPGEVKISILDSGNGIDSEALEKLMLPFFTTKPMGKGTGLGLSISKRIIEDHNGTFNYDQESENTSFTISLPLLDKAKSA